MPAAVLLGWEPSPAAAQLRRRTARLAARAKQEQPRGAGAVAQPAPLGSRPQGVAGSSWETYWSPELFLCKADISSSASTQPPSADELEPPCKPSSSLGAEGAKAVLERPYPLLALPHAAAALLQHGADACGHMLQEPRPAPAVAAGAVAGSFLLGLHHTAAVAAAGGSVPFGGVASASVVALGSASCLASLGAAPADGDTVALCPWSTLALACLCSFLAPLPLAPLPSTAVASLVGPVRLALPGAVGAVVLFELGHRHWSRIDGARVALFRDAERDLDVSSSDDGAQWNDGLLGLVREHWWRHFGVRPGGQLGVGCAFLAVDVSITYFATHLDLLVTQWKNTFFNTLQAKDVVGFHHQLWDFVPLTLASTLGSIYGSYLTTLWDLRWREELTQDFVGMWMGMKSYYYVRFADQGSGALDNFDQRIVEDTSIFVSNSRALLSGATGALIRLMVFFPALVRLAPSPTVWQLCLVLSLASSVATHLVGRSLSMRNAALQRTEADFRTAMMRTRLFAEPIALQHSEAAESAGAMHYFEGIKAATWMVARSAFNLSTFTSAYGLVGSVFPILVLVPYYFHGDISLGLMFQIEGVLGGVRQSLDFFIGAYGDI
ncbi:unnamed protein product [Prorocentrum cordatum]|uniref:ABC transmembrane type-1 domain-containing protein n=1 Tax=Prorocentrum cordatum TaxID=2364126 RepID=A0ABN9T2K3_9DINO|nr:unnamed protein product [Polarella glacialis]